MSHRDSAHIPARASIRQLQAGGGKGFKIYKDSVRRRMLANPANQGWARAADPPRRPARRCGGGSRAPRDASYSPYPASMDFSSLQGETGGAMKAVSLGVI